MRRFIAVVAVLAATATHAAIIAGPEHNVSRPELGLAYGSQQVLAIASDGTSYLVTWQNSSPGWPGVFLSLIRPDGKLLTVPSRTLQAGYGAEVSIVWTGDAYLVVWFDGTTNTAKAVRIAGNGEIASDSIVVAKNMAVGSLAWNGHHALVVLGTSTATRLALLDANGNVVAGDLLLPFARSPYFVTVSAAGDRFVAAWAETGNIGGNANTRVMATSIDDAGNVGAIPVALVHDLPKYVASLSAAPLGSRVAIAFALQSGGTAVELRRITIQPATLETQELQPIGTSSQFVNVVASGSDVLVYWNLFRDGNLLLESMSFTDGTLKETRLGASYAPYILAGSNGDSLLSVWIDTRFNDLTDGNWLLNGALLDAGGASVRKSSVTLALSNVAQSLPAMASAGDVSLVAWIDLKTTTSGDLMVTRVDSRGVPIDAGPIVIETNVPAWSPLTAGFTGQVWIVSYVIGDPSSQHHVYRRVSGDGLPIDDAPLDTGGVVYPKFASNGTTSVLVGRLSNTVGVTRLTPAGDVIDTLVIARRPGYDVNVAAAGDEFLVTWGEGSNYWQFPSPNRRDVMASRLDATGAPIDAAPTVIANSKADEWTGAVASDGRDFLVMYIQDGTLKAKRVLHEGATASETVLGTDAFTATITRISGRYFVVYATSSQTRSDLWITTLDDEGAIVDAPGTLDGQSLPSAVVALHGAKVLIGYQKWSGNVPRAFVRPLSVGAAARSRGARH